MQFKSAYYKLTALYVLIVMLISVGFSIGIFQISTNELDRGLGRQQRVFRNLPPDSAVPYLPNLDQFRNDQLAESQANLRDNLILFNLLILVLSSFASYFWARRTMKPIENAMEAQNHFTADASHELRTPLTAIKTEIEVGLRDKKMTLPSAKKLLESNLEEVAKLESLSNSLLRLSRLQKDEVQNFAKVSLEEVAVEAYEKIAVLATKKQIEFKNQFADLKVRGDKQSLVELLVILLDNAIKYSPPKSKISIKIVQDKKHAILSVKDQGVGIKSSDLPHIFDRFYRADQSRSKEKADGYGLGLSIAAQIASMHHGEIKTASQLAKGTTFSVILPKER